VWDGIALGHHQDAREWMAEAIAIVRNGHMFTLRFRGCPKLTKFVRHRT
jgi:hypothetical protein